METRYHPELVLKRKICESCGEGIYEFAPESGAVQKYVCTDCTLDMT
ncbi:MAG TPA: hypothetical protein VIO11_03525 [Candidatus Methanoperedens sp.]